MGGCFSTEPHLERPQPEPNVPLHDAQGPSVYSNVSAPIIQPHNIDAPIPEIQVSGIVDIRPKCKEQGQEEACEPVKKLQDASFSSASAMQEDDAEEMVVTSIRATGVSLSLRRIPAGFYIVVQHSGLEWRTEIKRVSLDSDVIEWHGPIPLSSNATATVSFRIRASYELQPTLGDGEELQKLTVTVEELLERSANNHVFAFLPEDGCVVSACSSLSVAIKKRRREMGESSTLGVHIPHSIVTGLQHELEYATNRGHIALSCYRKHGVGRDLEHAIEAFQCAQDLCTPDDPWHAAVQSNIATAKFLQYQADHNDVLLNVAHTLFLDALLARPVGHPDRPWTLIQLAIVHFAQFQRWRSQSRITQAEALLEEAKELSAPRSHEDRAADFMLQLYPRCATSDAQPVQSSSVLSESSSSFIDQHSLNYGTQLLDRYEQSEHLDDLKESISIFERFVLPTSISGKDYLAGLSCLGIALWYRFKHLDELDDLERAILMFGKAVDLMPENHPDRLTWLNNLGNSLRARFERLGVVSDLEKAILRLKEALDLASDSHPSKPRTLSNLGISLVTRFEHLGDIRDLEQGILRQREALDLAYHGKPRMLSNLGNSLRARFQHLGELADIEQAILGQREAVDLTPNGHPDKPAWINNLAISFIARFERLGELSDLEQGILREMEAISLTSDGLPEKPTMLSNLGSSLRARFQRLGEVGDLEKAIIALRRAVDLTLDGHPDKPCILSNLGNCLRARFQRLDDINNLEQAILRLREAVDLSADGHPDKPHMLSNLGNSFVARFERLGEVSDLEQGILRHQKAVDLTPDGHPDKPAWFNNLGCSFKARFHRLSEIRDLEQAILRFREAVGLSTDSHPDKPTRLNNLGFSLTTRFECLGEISDLEEAVLRLRGAVDLTPDTHPDKPRWLTNLGNSLRARFERLGELENLEQAILRLNEAVALTPDGHPDKLTVFNNLGVSLFARFQRLGKVGDLEQSILRQREAVDLSPNRHPDKPRRLNNLGTSLFTRFQRLHDLGDLEQAILRLKEAINLTPDGHGDKPAMLGNLGSSVFTRFEHLDELGDLEQTILRLEEAVDLTPDGHPDKPRWLSNLGNSFRVHFERLGELGNLEQAILRVEEAVDLMPGGHPDKPAALNNLGSSLFTRFQHLENLGDLEQTIIRFREAVNLTPDGHPDKPGRLINLGHSFITRFTHLGEVHDQVEAISVYSPAARAITGTPATRFSASKNWISCARALGHPSLLEAYSFAIVLLPQIAWIGSSLRQRYREMVQGTDVVREAAAAALDVGQPKRAVEWLEQGRSVIWRELFHLRSSYEELEFTHPDHAHRLRQLSAELDYAGAAHEKSLSLLSENTLDAGNVTRSLKQEADKHRELAIQRDELLQEIRGLSGFERFLLHKEFSQMRASAHSGPIIVLNAAESRCDALIVRKESDHVIHVPLSNFSFKRLEGLQTSLKSLVRREGTAWQHDRPGKWKSILSILWKSVVKPVLDALEFSTPGSVSRIFWCPTGPFTFLPIHAAGLYDEEHSEPGHKVFDFAISSYVPTIGVLAPSPKFDVASSRDIHLLAVGQPSSDGLSPLPGVNEELGYIGNVIQNSLSTRTNLLESPVGSVEEVLVLMKEADWVHFACHGVQDDENPANSGLCLANGRRLKLSDIISLQRPRGGLAFLSACQTAMGDKKLSDEAIHIAAGMLFAGYGSVIATMWSISDNIAPRVAKDVYEQLFRSRERPDPRETARALEDAIRRVREAGASFDEWLPFIHLGL